MLDALAQAFQDDMLAQDAAERRMRPASTSRNGLDTLSAAGAGALARKIKAFWQAAGFDVDVTVVTAGVTHGGDPIFSIRTRQLPMATIGTVFASQVKQPRPRPQLVVDNAAADVDRDPPMSK